MTPIPTVRRIARWTVPLCLLACLVAPAHAADDWKLDSDTFEGLRARHLGPGVMSGRISCIDGVSDVRNTLWVGTDFGPGSLTTSGYPRVVKLWTRGTPLSSATTVFEGKDTDVASYGTSLRSPDGRHDLVIRVPAFYRQEVYLHRDGKLTPLAIPETADFNGIWKDQVLFSLRAEWTAAGRSFRSCRGSTGCRI